MAVRRYFLWRLILYIVLCYQLSALNGSPPGGCVGVFGAVHFGLEAQNCAHLGGLASGQASLVLAQPHHEAQLSLSFIDRVYHLQ
jgi:hypothetical protein